MLVTLSILFITTGQVVAYVIGWVLSSHEHGWRLMVGLGAVPAIFQFLLVIFLPETPRWLMLAGHARTARVVLKKVYGARSDAIVEEVLGGIDAEMMKEDAASQAMYPSTPEENAWPWLTRLQRGIEELFSIGGNRRALTIACLLQGLQQLCGFVCPYLYSCWPLLILSSEFFDVLLSHDILSLRFFISNLDISVHRCDQFHLYLGRVGHY